jgi:O-antigen/teichoic acid export membrane protein
VATFSHQGATFATNFLVIQLLDHVTYGKFSLISLTAFYAATILQFAVGPTVSRFVARYVCDRTQLSAVIRICGAFSLVSGLLGFSVLFFASDFLSTTIFTEPSLILPIAIISVSVPSLIGMGFLNGLLQGLHGFRTLAFSSGISGVVFVAMVGAGAWKCGLNGAIAGFVAGSTLRCVIMGTAAFLELESKRVAPTILSWSTPSDRRMMHEIFRFQVPAGLAGCLTIPTLWLIPTILMRNTQDFSDVAFYTVILMIKSIIVLPAAVIALALQPSAENALETKQPHIAVRVFRTSSIVGLFVVVVSALLIATFAKETLALFGSDFTSVIFELRLMMIAAVAEAASVGLSMRVQATNRMWASISATLLPRDLVMLSVALMFTSQYGLEAIIFAHLAGALVNLVGTYWLSQNASRSFKMA